MDKHGSTKLDYVFGKVKWFGGYNNKKNCENEFGFIESFDKQDVFVHKNALKNAEEIDENDLVLYRPENGNKGINGRDVIVLKANDRAILAPIADILKIESQRTFALKSIEYQRLFDYLLKGSLGDAFFKLLTQDINNLTFIAPLINRTKYWKELFLTHFAGLSFDEMENLGFKLVDIPSSIIDERIVDLEKHLQKASQLYFNKHIPSIINHISISAILYLIFKGVVTSINQLHDRLDEVSQFVKSTVLRNKTDVKEFVRKAYIEEFSSFNEYSQHPLISTLISESLVKLKIYKKDMSFVEDLSKNKTLINKAEFYILAKLIPLLSEKNNNQVSAIESILLDEIWQGLVSGKIDLNDDSIFNLFPQCYVMGRVGKAIPLSCEAFHWTPKDTNEDVFLCRSNKCIDPQILPDNNRDFLEFTIYDWLDHYGICYVTPDKPSKRDFPIKLAGYLNRLKELFSRLHCRCCSTILKPNLSYARDKATVYNAYSNQFETKNIYAAYRVTVFECANEKCQDFSQGIYVTHCLNYKCHEYIDSRDSQVKCDNDWYICASCNSCCASHDKNKPK